MGKSLQSWLNLFFQKREHSVEIVLEIDSVSLTFRPSLVVDSGDVDGHLEFQWKNKHIAIGSAVIEILDPCPRCVMVTRAINNDIPEDREVLRHIVRDLNQSVGVYARVLSPGKCSVGDKVRFL